MTQHFVEVETIKWDGTVTIWRFKVPTEHATRFAEATAFEMMREKLMANRDWRKGYSPWFDNDFGEKCNIRVAAYGSHAQVHAGLVRISIPT